MICKVFEKTGPGPQNGSQYGSFEEDWDYDDVCAEPDLSGVSPAMPAPTDCQSCPVGIESTSSFALVEPGPSSAEPGSSLAEPHINELSEGGDINELLGPFFMEHNGLLPIESNNNEVCRLVLYRHRASLSIRCDSNLVLLFLVILDSDLDGTFGLK